ncbi:MAG TPA: nitrite reductase small subunit NirD [Polyangia bacterium]|nr:nitrite reductase small subunit NirD [Polyangia bacterium]
MSAALQIEPASAGSAPQPQWVDVCAIADIPVGCGVAALLSDQQVALVRPGEDETVFGLSNYDPFSEAFVIARGIVGDCAGRPKIASPIYKQSFDLETGVCLDDPSVHLAVYPVRVRDGRVEVGTRR